MIVSFDTIIAIVYFPRHLSATAIVAGKLSLADVIISGWEKNKKKGSTLLG